MYEDIVVVGYVARETTPEDLMIHGDGVSELRIPLLVQLGSKGYTHWWRVSIMGDTAETINTSVGVGDFLWVRGQLSAGEDGNPRLFETPDGEITAAFDLRAWEAILIPAGAKNLDPVGGAERVLIAGNLGRAPDLNYLPSGDPVANLSVAANIGWGDEEATHWWRVSAFGSQAEAINKYLDKGDPVLVSGTVRADESTGGPRVFSRRDGSAGASWEMTGRVQFLPKGRTNEGSGGGRKPTGKGRPAAKPRSKSDGIPW